jgi:4-hydroxybenzoate polyprenyltransferase
LRRAQKTMFSLFVSRRSPGCALELQQKKEGVPAFKASVQQQTQSEYVASPPQPMWRLMASVLRIHQWVKNLLIFVPIITSHRIWDMHAVVAATITFAAFCLCASAAYITNDLLDLESDRRHSLKRLRPFAARALSVKTGYVLVPLLLAASAFCILQVSQTVAAILLLYLILTLVYSLYLKRKLLLDVYLLSALYTIRIAAGGAATGIPLSPWLLSFAIFLFLSMAFSKRVSELQNLRAAGGHSTPGRAYRATDLEQVNIFGVTSGFLAALIFALYINSDMVRSLYRHPGVLWLMCPLVLYWITRIWILSFRGELHEDPILFAVKDPVTYGVGLASVLLLVAATANWGGFALR